VDLNGEASSLSYICISWSSKWSHCNRFLCQNSVNIYLLNAIYTSNLLNFPTVMQIGLCINGTVPVFWSCKMLNLSIYLPSSMRNKFPLYSNVYSWCRSHMYYQELTNPSMEMEDTKILAQTPYCKIFPPTMKFLKKCKSM